jgi:hypothetical protein
MQAPADTVVVSMIETPAPDGSPAPAPGTVAHTPGEAANVKLNVISRTTAIGVRFVHEFIQAFLGSLLAAGFGVSTHAVNLGDFQSVVMASAASAGIIAIVGLLRNAVTVFKDLEGKYPLASGGI